VLGGVEDDDVVVLGRVEGDRVEVDVEVDRGKGLIVDVVLMLVLGIDSDQEEEVEVLELDDDDAAAELLEEDVAGTGESVSVDVLVVVPEVGLTSVVEVEEVFVFSLGTVSRVQM